MSTLLRFQRISDASERRAHRHAASFKDFIMRHRWLLIALTVLTVVALAVGAGLFGIYHAAQEVPDFYAEAVAMAETHADRNRDDFTDRALALAGDVKKEGDWSSVFTDEQINGWLAVDLVEKHPTLLPPNFQQPRVKIFDDHIRVGAKCEFSGVTTIAWMDLEGRMTVDHELAVRFREIRAGAVPLPLSTIIDALTKAAAKFEVPLRWTTEEGDPIAIIGLPTPEKKGQRYELQRFTLIAGQMFLAGRTIRVDEKAAPPKVVLDP